LVPLLPLVLINGAIGIATGFSTKIAQYSIKEIIDALFKML